MTAPPTDIGEPLRVLHVIPSLEPGGAERGVVELVSELGRRENFDVELCVLSHPPGGNALSLPEMKVTFLDSPVHGRSAMLRRWFRMRSLIKSSRPVVVHSHLWPAAACVARAGRGLPFGHVVHIRDTPPSFRSRDLKSSLTNRIICRRILSSSPSFVSVSQAAKEYAAHYLDIPESDIRVILNGILPDRVVSGKPRESTGRNRFFMVGTAGRLVSEKGQALLIDAVALLAAKGHELRLTIAGSGRLETALRDHALERGVEDRVHLAGEVEDMAEFYRSHDLFVLPSLSSEGLPRVVLEAMTAGCAVIASDCAGVREVIRSDQDGLVVPVGDVPALADAILRLMRDPDLLATYQWTGRQRDRKDFHVCRVADEVEDHYRYLLPQASGKASNVRS